MNERRELRVASSWQGEPVPTADHVRMVATLDAVSLALEVDAPFHGDPAPPGPAGPTANLWEHEVVELFLVHDDGGNGPPRYTEVELSPHGHHLVLQLVGLRTVVATLLPLEFKAGIEGSRWWGRALLPFSLLPPRPWRVNAFAMHGAGDGRRHLAAFPVPGPHPDFHRLAVFPRF